jgi:TetR/AcrR family transcriptional repressor of nem operon
MRSRPHGDTATRILDSAERLVQSRGFNGFSYADIAAELGITKASLHYHFASKAELGQAVITRYTARFVEQLAMIESAADAGPDRLKAYADLYADHVHEQKLGLCGMLAAELQTLPGPMRQAIVTFFDAVEGWLERVLDQGRADRSLHFDGASAEIARAIVALLQGALLIARPYGDAGRVRAMTQQLFANLSRPTEPAVG